MSANDNRAPVLVVGGGIGGLGAALALSRKGISVHVIEQAPEFKEIGAGIQLGPNVFRMLEYLGLTEDMNKWAVFPLGLEMRDSITGQTVGEIGASPAGRELVQAIVDETAAVAQAHGVGLDPDRVLAALENAFTHHAGHKTSMLQDREAGRRTEVESIAGAVVGLGQEAGIRTPVLWTLCNLLRQPAAACGCVSPAVIAVAADRNRRPPPVKSSAGALLALRGEGAFASRVAFDGAGPRVFEGCRGAAR